ncbi:MAG TPA: methyltransferase domain-containing protein [Gemmatimonadales bacterium]
MTLTFSPVGVEALDDPAADPHLVERMLNDIARSNRWLGGTLAAQYGVAALLRPEDRGHGLALLDIGTGAGDIPRALQRWAARRHGVALDLFGVERITAAGRLARRGDIRTILACAGALPLRERSVDIVLVSQVLHHFDHDSAVRLLAEAQRIARRGVVVADLATGPVAQVAFRMAGRALGMHHVTISDGVTSLKRGYSTGSLSALLANAGVTRGVVCRRPIARVVAWWAVES